MTVGEKIYSLRTQAGYSQEEFAELIGVSRQSVSKWETSAVMPDTEYVVKICKILSVSTDTLLIDGDLPAVSAGAMQSQQNADCTYETNTVKQTEEMKQEKTGRAMSIVGFVFSFILGIVGLIVSSIAYRKEKQPQAINHLAISGIAISSAKIYATISFAMVYGILYGLV